MNTNDFIQWIEDKNKWSLVTFGEGQRPEGVIKHIESELQEIRDAPNDIMEWVDVILLAIDGAFRAGFSAKEIVSAMIRKQEINKTRVWTVPNGDEPSFHIREGE